MKTLKAALFDLDGTLFNTEKQYSIFWERIGALHHPEIPDFANVIKGTTLTNILDTYFPSPIIRNEIVESLNHWESGMRYNFYPGAVDFLISLRTNGVKMAIVTSSNAQKMNSVRRQMPDFDKIFDKVLTAEDFEHSKPNPDCYLKGAAALGCTTNECVVFEDAYNGLAAGRAAGIFTFGMTTTHSRAEIAHKCDYVLDDFKWLKYEDIVHLLKISER